MHYNVAVDVAAPDSFLIYNPDTIVKISLPSVEQKIEALYIRKRFEEALKLSNNSYGRPLLAKLQTAHFNQLLNTGEIEQAKELIVSYMGQDRDLWVHWLQMIMKKKQLSHFIEYIPMEHQATD